MDAARGPPCFLHARARNSRNAPKYEGGVSALTPHCLNPPRAVPAESLNRTANWIPSCQSAASAQVDDVMKRKWKPLKEQGAPGADASLQRNTLELHLLSLSTLFPPSSSPTLAPTSTTAPSRSPSRSFPFPPTNSPSPPPSLIGGSRSSGPSLSQARAPAAFSHCLGSAVLKQGPVPAAGRAGRGPGLACH